MRYWGIINAIESINYSQDMYVAIDHELQMLNIMVLMFEY